MFFRSGDPLGDFDRLDREYTKWLEGLPVCDVCGEPIQDEKYFQKDGENICLHCLEHFMKQNNI